MPNYRVRPCRNNYLAGSHGNRRCRKGILLEHNKNDEKSERGQNVSGDNDRYGNCRPRKAMIERRQDHRAHEYAGCQKLY